MRTQVEHTTIDEFEDFINRPENRERAFEYIGGRIVEVVSNNYASEIAMFIGGMILAFVLEHDLGRITGADGGYVIAGERYIPDAAFILSPTNSPADGYSHQDCQLPACWNDCLVG